MGYSPFEHKAGLGTGRVGGRWSAERAARAWRGARARAGRWGATLARGTQHGRAAGKRGALGACAARALGARAECRRAAWACCWAVGCALGAFSLFLTRFDLVLFLSQFLDIVREPGS